MEFCKLSELPLRHDFELEPYEINTSAKNETYLTKMFSLQTDRNRVINGYWIDKDTDYWYLVRGTDGSYTRVKADTLKNVVELF